MADSNATQPSAEFVALCQTEIGWLREGLGADRGAVYLTQQRGKQAPALIPIATYPEEFSEDSEQARPMLPSSAGIPALPAAPATELETLPLEEDDASPCQVVLPLLHEGLVLGLLVAGRRSRHWSPQELRQIERAAKTLTWACALDRRQSWTQRRLLADRQQQRQQRERLHDWLHQVRNPLTALRTFGKLLQKRLHGSQHADIAANMMRESDRLRDLLDRADAAIDVSGRSDSVLPAQDTAPAALLPPRPTATLDIGGELEPLLTSARAMARARGLKFASEVPPELPPVCGDREALREILNNLLDNALKYTPTGGGVGVRAGLERPAPQGEGTQQGIAVCDSGPGIPLGDRARIFERRYRGVQAEGPLPGTGLGLAIAKELAQQMGGDIELLPSQRGATFVLWLAADDATAQLAG